MTEAMKRMIIDCDPGHDDAIALVLAHRHARVAGITTVSGNVPLKATTANALLLTALLDVDTPVHAGAVRPLVGEPQHAPHVHGESGLGDVTRMEHDKVVASDDGGRVPAGRRRPRRVGRRPGTADQRGAGDRARSRLGEADRRHLAHGRQHRRGAT